MKKTQRIVESFSGFNRLNEDEILKPANGELSKKDEMKYIQSIIYLAYNLLVKGKTPEDIKKEGGVPKEYSDGILGPKTKELFTAFKKEIERKSESGELLWKRKSWDNVKEKPTNEFGKYEIQIAEQILVNVQEYYEKSFDNLNDFSKYLFDIKNEDRFINTLNHYISTNYNKKM